MIHNTFSDKIQNNITIPTSLNKENIRRTGK